MALKKVVRAIIAADAVDEGAHDGEDDHAEEAAGGTKKSTCSSTWSNW